MPRSRSATRLVCLFALALCLTLGGHASAQSFTADARTVGMGGGGSNANIAISMVDPAGPYAVIPIPLGLI